MGIACPAIGEANPSIFSLWRGYRGDGDGAPMVNEFMIRENDDNNDAGDDNDDDGDADGDASDDDGYVGGFADTDSKAMITTLTGMAILEVQTKV